jgi:hypothetical protein
MRTALNHRYPAIQGELESESESESEWEDEYEVEGEEELEGEAFFGGLAKIAGSLLGEGEEELEGEDEWEGEVEGFAGESEFEFEFETEAEAEAEMEAEGELEAEFEAEAEEEAEGFVNPVRRIYRDAELMAHLATRASESESEEEAEAFIGALIPMAARLIPRAASLISRNAPSLIKGATSLVRTLRRNPRTRALVRAMPVIIQRTAQSLADQAQNGAPLGTDDIIGTLGDITGRVLQGPGRRRAINAVGVFDRRYRRRAQWSRRRGGYRAYRGYAGAGYPRAGTPYRRVARPGYGAGYGAPIRRSRSMGARRARRR